MGNISRILFQTGLYLFVITLPFSRTANNLSIALMVLSWVGAQGWRYENLRHIKNNIPGLFSILLFLVFALSLSYSKNISVGIKNTEALATLFIFPILFSYFTQSRVSITGIYKTLIYITSVAFLINLLAAVLRTLNYGLYYQDPSTTIVYNNFLYHRLASAVGVHPSFLTIFAGISIVILINPDHLKLNINPKVRITLIVFLAINMLLLQAIAVSFAIIIALISIFILGRKLSNFKTLRYIGLILILISVLSVILFFKLNWSKDLVNFNIESTTNWNSVSLRLALWESAKQVISENPLWGVGIGDVKEALSEMYEKTNFYFAYYNRYHPHNQFLYSWLMAGIPAFILTILLYFALIRSAINKSNYVYISISIIFILFSISDIPLARNKSLIFLMFVMNLSEYSFLNKRE